MFGQTRGLFFGQTRESAPTTRGDDGDGAVLLKRWSGVFMVFEMCLYGGGGVLFKCWGCAFMAVEWCFVGCKSGALQG